LPSRDASLTVLALCATMAVLYWAQAAFIPIVLSILISYALEPVVRRLVALRVPRAAAAALVVVALAGGLASSVYLLADDATAVLANLPKAAARLREALPRSLGGGGAIEQVQRAAEELQRTADEATGTTGAPRGVQRVQVETPAFNIREYIMWGSASVLAFTGQALLVGFFVFFLLASGDSFAHRLARLAGQSGERRGVVIGILNEINVQIERFLVVHVIASLVVGVATWIAFRLIGLEQAALLGIAAGVLNSVPYFGPVIVSAGAAVAAFLQFGTLSMALVAAGAALAITSLEGWLLMPVLTSRVVHINEVAVFVALIVWSFIWGIWGTLLAVPMLVVIKACCDHVGPLKPVGELLGK
jgi:predicted PurR-regulated permease PerM